MKNWVLLLLFTTMASAQLSFVNTKTGFTDLRESQSATSALVAKLPNGHIAFAFEDQVKSGWIAVDVTIGGKDLSGFVAKTDIVPISNLTPILYNYSNEHKTILKREDIGIIVTDVAFDRTTANLTFSNTTPPYLEKINGKPIYGTDGNVPSRQYGFLDVAINGSKIVIPASALEHLYEPNLENTEAFYDDKNDILYISSLNSDGAGGYHVLWIIEKRKYKMRHVFLGF